MEGTTEEKQRRSLSQEEKITSDSPMLVALLNEMKNGLDDVTTVVQDLMKMVTRDDFSTVDGLSYMEAKNLLLLDYCQSIVYYLLRKAKGLSVAGHPVISSLVEIRLFLEKIRPIEKKLEYQVQKLTQAANNVPNDMEEYGEKEKNEQEEDPRNLRPKPDMLISKRTESGGVYRPVRLAPTTMDDDKVSKQEKQDKRRDREILRQAKNSAYLKELLDDVEGRPEEIRENIGAESRELSRYKAKWDERARQEEELFTRAPISKIEKKRQKHLLKSRDGLLGLADSFYDEIRTLPLEDKSGKDDEPDHMSSKSGRKFKKHRRH